ncbi:MAG: rod shape-determining protein [Acutalibacteraceae bacterium]|nr:rod shape-determining protein [Clostridia bacterium]MEE3449255.1 rod shape-determining protein [Acutalibacteraceae bacterium]
MDIAIDLGTSNTRIYVADKGKFLDEPSVVTINLDNDDIIAVGSDAYKMIGRTSQRLSSIEPIVGGVISDFFLVENMIKIQLGKANISRVIKPRVVACIPGEITDVEKRAVVNAILSIGVRSVSLIEASKAAAIGAGLDIRSPHGRLILDIGGGTTEIAVISLGDISASRSMKIAGNNFDDEIIKYVRKTYNLIIGKVTAENTKKEIGAVIKPETDKKIIIKGRNTVTGLPQSVELSSSEMVESLNEIAVTIAQQVQDVLEETPPELVGDIYKDGIILTGGGSLIYGLDQVIKEHVKLNVRIADKPGDCVINGCGYALRYIGQDEVDENGAVNPLSSPY